MAMPYPPPLPLPVPAWMPSVPEKLPGHDLASIGLMNPEEELSNQQLNFTACPCHHPPRPASHDGSIVALHCRHERLCHGLALLEPAAAPAASPVLKFECQWLSTSSDWQLLTVDV